MPTKQHHFLFFLSFFFFFFFFFGTLIMAILVTDTDRRTILKTKLNLVHENKNNPEGPKVQSNLNCTIQQLQYIILKKFSAATFVTILRQSWIKSGSGGSTTHSRPLYQAASNDVVVQKLITIVFGPTKIDFQKIFSAFTSV